MTQRPSSFDEILSPDLSFKMIGVEGGTFMMGGQDEEALDSEKPVHQVRVPSFHLGKDPVTQAVWEEIMGDNPARFTGADRPVENVSWKDTQRFITILNQRSSQTYRLPTEAEWEYAARGGGLSEGYLYAGSDKLKEVGWYDENSGSQTHAVGQLFENELGLFDMSGNVLEWVADHWHDTYVGAPEDGSPWLKEDSTLSRVLRGGSWIASAANCRASSRYRYLPGDRDLIVGFRLACSL
ncbi:MAG: formylglycine-generating enzyme family protein [Bacteroidota bacterium]